MMIISLLLGLVWIITLNYSSVSIPWLVSLPSSEIFKMADVKNFLSFKFRTALITGHGSERGATFSSPVFQESSMFRIEVSFWAHWERTDPLPLCPLIRLVLTGCALVLAGVDADELITIVELGPFVPFHMLLTGFYSAADGRRGTRLRDETIACNTSRY